MQEGTSSLMQMAKVSVAVDALQRAGLPFIAVLNDPTYGGVSASYAMQADVKIATSDARIGFAGPQVILNTMCEADQQVYDTTCPSDFQSAGYVWEHGQLDLIVQHNGDIQSTQNQVLDTVAQLVHLLCPADSGSRVMAASGHPSQAGGSSSSSDQVDEQVPAGDSSLFNYTNSRRIDRPQVDS
jgi:acetyl-CoA carboxylase beta subunit